MSYKETVSFFRFFHFVATRLFLVMRRVSAQGNAFWGLVHTAPHFGGQIPIKKNYFGA